MTEADDVPGRSVFEDRDFGGWRDRLRRLVGREKPPAPLCEALRLVVGTGGEQGRPIGYRCEDGSVLRFPERDPEDLPASAWTWIAGYRVSETEPPGGGGP